MGEGFLSVEQVAQRLGVPRSWVYTQAEAGKLPAVKLGKYVRFNPEELEKWLLQQRRGHTLTHDR